MPNYDISRQEKPPDESQREHALQIYLQARGGGYRFAHHDSILHTMTFLRSMPESGEYISTSLKNQETLISQIIDVLKNEAFIKFFRK